MTGPSNMGTTPSPCAVTTARARRKSLPKRRPSRMGQPGYTARHRCFRRRPQTQYQMYLAESNQPPFGKLEPLAILKTNPDDAGIVQAIGPLKDCREWQWSECGCAFPKIPNRHRIEGSVASGAAPTIINKF